MTWNGHASREWKESERKKIKQTRCVTAWVPGSRSRTRKGRCIVETCWEESQSWLYHTGLALHSCSGLGCLDGMYSHVVKGLHHLFLSPFSPAEITADQKCCFLADFICKNYSYHNQGDDSTCSLQHNLSAKSNHPPSTVSLPHRCGKILALSWKI